MPLTLGSAFAPRQVVEELEPQVYVPTIDELRNEQLLVAIGNLREALVNQPAPVIQVAEPDLSAIVNAVNGLKGPASAEEIAGAVRDAIAPGGEPDTASVLRDVVEALKKLDFRMTGLASSGGGSGGGVTSRIQNEPGTVLDTQEAALDTRYEWQAVAGSSKPLYIGTHRPGSPTTDPLWRIQKFTYAAGPAGDAVPTLVQTQTGAWDSRAAIF